MSASSDSPDPISFQVLRDRPILDLATTESVGRLDGLWVDPKAGRVVGLLCKGGFLGQKRRAFAWSQVQAIGEDAIVVAIAADLGPEGSEFVQPTGAYDLHGHEVWTDGGNRIGLLIDLAFFRADGRIDRYGFSGNGWGGFEDTGIYWLPANAALSGGSKRLVVREALAKDAIADERPADRPDLPLPDWETLRSRAGSAAKQLQERVQGQAENLADLAKDRLGDRAETLAEKARHARDRARDLARHARDRAEILAEKARDRLEGSTGDRATEDDFNPAAAEALPPATTTIDVAAQSPETTAKPAPTEEGDDPWTAAATQPPKNPE
jgi:uncharacterized protein YrrD/ElaB/YqjD/DUF883 family membrane-anchored ribosome-binding protein